MPILPEVVKAKLHTIEILTAIYFLSGKVSLHASGNRPLLGRRVNNIRYVGYEGRTVPGKQGSP